MSTELTVYTSASDGYIKAQSDVSFLTVRNAVIGNPWDETTLVNVGTSRSSSTWQIWRGFLFFDTSALPDGATISAVILSLYIQSHVVSGGDFDIVIQNGQPTYPHDTLVAGDFLYSHYSGDGGSINSAPLVNAAYNDITLNATGRGWISKTGTTKLCLRSSKDINGNDIAEGTGSVVGIYALEQGSAYRAKLVITYSVSAPTVTTQAVSAIDEITATGNGNITDLGGDTVTKRGICWNTTGSPTVADSKSEEEGSFGTGAFTRPMTGLARGDRYYVKAYAYNSGGYGYGSEVNFYTYPAVTTYAPTDIQRADPTTVTANGLIELDVVENITTRGFKFGLTETDTWSEYENGGGTYSEGAFSLTIDTNIVTDTTYFIRAYAVGAWGTKYGSYVEFKTAYPYGANKVEIKSEATASSGDIAAVGGKRSLTIENHLIQNQTLADIISAGYLADYKDQKTKLIVTRPTPAPYEIGDTITRGSLLFYYAAVSALISYAPAATAEHNYGLADRDILIRKLNISFSAGNYVSVIELESS